jgi:hypothetical protein
VFLFFFALFNFSLGPLHLHVTLLSSTNWKGQDTIMASGKEGVSEFVVLRVTPVLLLTALLLSSFALLAPSAMLHEIALLTFKPSTILTSTQTSSGDGPSLFMGLLGSFIIYFTSRF